MANDVRYKYSPLAANHFRLLVLFPGTGEERINIRIETHDLSSPPKFTALSYCWGTGSKDVACNHDSSSQGEILVTKDLYHVLQEYRSDTDSQRLWVDQICIDQDDDVDKASQVRLMADIYSRAKSVVIWLGASDQHTKVVFDIVEGIMRQTRRGSKGIDSERERDRDPDDNERLHVESQLQLGPADSPEWFAFRMFLQRPWFQRTWTFQEVVLAEQAYLWCGSHRTSWRKFMLACLTVAHLDRLQKTEPSHLQNLHAGMHFMDCCAHVCVLRRLGIPIDPIMRSYQQLGSLMRYAMRLHTSIGHDKIYGLLGIARDVDVSQFPIRYNATIRETYAHVTKHLIAQYGDLAPLGLKTVSPMIDPGKSGPADLPSWVPDYRLDDSQLENPYLFGGPMRLARGKDRAYRATGCSKTNIVVDSSLKLHLRGVFVGKIKIVSELSGNMTGSQSIGDNVLKNGSWHQLVQNNAEDGKYNFTDEPCDLAYARTRVGDYLPGEDYPQDRAARPQPLLQVPELESSQIITTPDGERVLASEADGHMPSMILRTTTGKRLCISDNKFMCLCHQNCIEDDEIWLIMGADMPCILRRLDLGRYHWMGMAYVHGIMDGEYLVRHFKNSDLVDAYSSASMWLEKLADGIQFPTDEIVLV